MFKQCIKRAAPRLLELMVKYCLNNVLWEAVWKSSLLLVLRALKTGHSLVTSTARSSSSSMGCDLLLVYGIPSLLKEAGDALCLDTMP